MSVARSQGPPRRLHQEQRPRIKAWPVEPPDELHPRTAAPPVAPCQRRELTPVGRALTAEQLDAVRAIMRLFVDDDLAKGISPARQLLCAACERWQSAPGFILYERSEFCNDCATDFETARLRGLARTAADYLNLIQRRASA